MHYIIIVKAWNDIIDTDKIGDTDTMMQTKWNSNLRLSGEVLKSYVIRIKLVDISNEEPRPSFPIELKNVWCNIIIIGHELLLVL